VDKVRKFNETELFFQPENGILSEDQVEAILLGWFFRSTRTIDRRGGTMASVLLNHETGLPDSAGALLPKHRAVGGYELALSLVIPPEDWAASLVYTDDLPQNAAFAPGSDQRDWQALSFKSKDTWSDEETVAVKENTRTTKRVIHRLSERGIFVTKPQIDDTEANFGTKELVHGEDRMTMGFQITYDGLRYAEEFARAHPRFMNAGHTLLDAMGTTLADKAPEWAKAERRNQAIVVG
jgi:hypothetical protein